MKRWLVLVLLWAGIVAPAFAQRAQVVVSTHTTNSAASAACVAAGGGCNSVNSTDTLYLASTNVGTACGDSNFGAWYRFPSPNTTYELFCKPMSGSSCPSGKVASGTTCVPWCETNHAIPATDPACVAPETCQYNPEILASDPACVAPPTCNKAYGDLGSTGAYLRSAIGGPYCDGTCGYTLPFVIGISGTGSGGGGADEGTTTQCYTFDSDSTQTEYCTLTQSFTGESCENVNNPTDASAPPAGETPTVGVVCPPNTVDNGAGVCVYAGVAGTAATPTSAGTTGTAGASTCAAGFTQNPITLKCEGAPTAAGCPQGTTLEGTICVSSGTGAAVGYGSSGTGANQVSSCGGPGQPACKVGFEDGPNFADRPVSEGGLSNSIGIGLMSPVDMSGTPTAQCPDDVELPHGITWKWTTVCNFALFLRPIILALAWLAAGAFVLGVAL